MKLRLSPKLLALPALGALTLYTYARHMEPNAIDVQRVRITIPHLPAHLEGFRIAQLSDFHAGATPLALIERAVALTNALHPDAVALTGDYVDSTPAAIFDLAPVLAKLEAQHGVYAVLGNHDLYEGFPQHRAIITYGLQHYGIELLNNRHVLLSGGLALAGVDEPYRGDPDLYAALHGIPSDTPVVLLVHRPDFADNYADDPRVTLQLSGHSHAGQMQLPLAGPLYLPKFARKYVEGLYRVDDMWLYVNRGIGITGRLKMRLNCPPEITLLTLSSR